MAKTAKAVFGSKNEGLRVLVGMERGRPVYVKFSEHRLETDDADVIAILTKLSGEKPHKVWLEGGVLCPVCYKTFKDEFGLSGHLRSHTQTEREAAGVGKEG